MRVGLLADAAATDHGCVVAVARLCAFLWH
jgi:hypothetical protein